MDIGQLEAAFISLVTKHQIMAGNATLGRTRYGNERVALAQARAAIRRIMRASQADPRRYRDA